MKREVLRELATRLRTCRQTLETGCGMSTVLFAAAGARHTVISPLREEHERIRAFCGEMRIVTDKVRFIVGDSRDELPRIQEPLDLDLVLIDGCHAFPSPFIDWFYAARRLRKDGLLIVDDTQIVTGWILREFLLSERERWSVEKEFRRTILFRKRVENVTDGFRWRQQPFCVRTRRFRKLQDVLRPLYQAMFTRRRK